MKIFNIFVIYFLTICSTDTCFMRKPKQPWNPYIPACIQILLHYKDQLLKYYPFAFSRFCRLTKRKLKVGINVELNYSPGATLLASNKALNESIIQLLKGADFCIYDTDSRLSGFLGNLYARINDNEYEESQGFSHLMLIDLEKTSKMKSADQLYFVLSKLLSKEESGVSDIRNEVIQLMHDLKKPNSKLYRNLLMIKPLSYII